MFSLRSFGWAAATDVAKAVSWAVPNLAAEMPPSTTLDSKLTISTVADVGAVVG